jgi:hypothetical protein
MLLGARAGYIIWYFKTDDKKNGGISINPQEIAICKYKEMLMSTVKDVLEILSYDSTEKIESERDLWFSQKSKKRKTGKRRCSKI